MNTSRLSGKRLFGFTLIELLMVLVLIAIATAAIVPQLGGSISGWQVREDAMGMLASVRLARQRALVRQETMAFIVDPNEGSFAVKNIDSSIDSSGIKEKFLIPKQYLGKGVKITKLEGFEQIGSQQGVVFAPDGRIKTAHIELTTNKGNNTGKWHILIEHLALRIEYDE